MKNLIAGAVVALFVIGSPSLAQEKVDFEKQIRPIFEKRCYQCHGAKRQKGKLRMDRKASVFQRKEKLVVPGAADKSYLYEVLTLDEDDEDLMPAKGGKLPADQIALIKTWIDEGAHWPDDSPEEKPAKDENAIDLPKLSPEQVAGEKSALAGLRKRGVLAQKVAANTEAVYVNYSLLGKKVGDADAKLLDGLESTLVWLNLSRTGITDGALAHVKKHRHLRQLNLANTAVSDAGLEHLASLTDLEYLNLYGTKVSDAGLAHLGGLKKLRKLYLWQTKATDDGAAALQKQLTEVKIDLGRYAEKMREIAKNLPVNTICPLMNRPVDAAQVVTHEGQKIGFCCKNCLAKFKKEPGKYIGKVKGFKKKPRPKKPKKAPKKPAPKKVAKAMNAKCPVTGRPVVARFNVDHDGKTVGFCCGRCRSAFSQNPGKYADKLGPTKKGKESASTSPVNTQCPFSGKPIQKTAVATYRGKTIAFCNTHCRDDFRKNPGKYAKLVARYFK